MKLYRVYILQNSQNKKYIGLSQDIQKRLEDHNNGLSKWTKNKGPWSIIWTSCFMSLSEAKTLESLLKKQKGGKGLLTLMEKFSS